MLYILSGPDDFSLNESLGEIKRSLGDEPLLAANTTVLDGQQVTPEQLGGVALTVPFLAEKRLIVVNGLLERFEPKGRAGRDKNKVPAAREQADGKSFSRRLELLPGSTVLVLVDGNVTRGNPLFRELASRAEVRAFPFLRRDKLAQWIKRRVGKEGGHISPQAVELLARLVGSNLWIMAGEINKLVLFASGGLINEDDVRHVVGYSQQANVFAMVDAILEFRLRLAQRSLQQLLQAGVSPSYLLFMLTRQVRLVLRAGELKRKGKSEREIQDRLALTSDFAWRKTSEQAAGYSLERLKEIYRKLLETDLSIKTGRYGGELALNILAAELCHQGRL